MNDLTKQWQAEHERLARLQLGRTLRVPLLNPSHPDFELTLTRTRLKMPKAPYRNGDSIQISLRDVEDVSLASRGQGAFWALRLADGTLERVPADLLPAEYKALELVTRIRVRALHCRGKKKSSAAALAALEAQVLTDGPTLGAIVVCRPKAPPEVYAVVRDLEEWNAVSAEVPPDHELYVPDDVAPPERDEL